MLCLLVSSFIYIFCLVVKWNCLCMAYVYGCQQQFIVLAGIDEIVTIIIFLILLGVFLCMFHSTFSYCCLLLSLQIYFICSLICLDFHNIFLYLLVFLHKSRILSIVVYNGRIFQIAQWGGGILRELPIVKGMVNFAGGDFSMGW